MSEKELTINLPSSGVLPRSLFDRLHAAVVKTVDAEDVAEQIYNAEVEFAALSASGTFAEAERYVATMIEAYEKEVNWRASLDLTSL